MPVSINLPKKPRKGAASIGTRLTVTIPPRDYSAVIRIAKQKKVSASWVVRDAVEKYVQGTAG
jgi:hypothetical protein